MERPGAETLLSLESMPRCSSFSFLLFLFLAALLSSHSFIAFFALFFGDSGLGNPGSGISAFGDRRNDSPLALGVVSLA